MSLISLNPLPSPPRSLYLKHKPLHPFSTLPKPKLSLKPSLHKSHNSTNVPSLLPATPKPQNDLPFSQTFHSLISLKPYILSQHKPILLGWLCSLVSVYSLSKTVPKMGKFSTFIEILDPITLKNEGLAVGVLVLARLVAVYWQQAFLWDAALNAVYRVRAAVFEKVLERDLEFFEGYGHMV